MGEALAKAPQDCYQMSERLSLQATGLCDYKTWLGPEVKKVKGGGVSRAVPRRPAHRRGQGPSPGELQSSAGGGRVGALALGAAGSLTCVMLAFPARILCFSD